MKTTRRAFLAYLSALPIVPAVAKAFPSEQVQPASVLEPDGDGLDPGITMRIDEYWKSHHRQVVFTGDVRGRAYYLTDLYDERESDKILPILIRRTNVHFRRLRAGRVT